MMFNTRKCDGKTVRDYYQELGAGLITGCNSQLQWLICDGNKRQRPPHADH